MAKTSKSAKATAQATIKRSAAQAAAVADSLSTAQMVSWIAILALIFLVPVAMTNISFTGPAENLFRTGPLTFDQFDTIKVYLQRVLTLIALAAWAWHVLTRPSKVRWTPVEWAILAFLGWVAISSIFSISPATAIFGKYRRYEGLLSFINYAAVLFLVLQFSDRSKRVRQLAITFFASGVVVNFYGVLQFLGKDPLRWGPLPFEPNRAFSTFGNPDLLGGYVVMTLTISLGLALSTNVNWKRAVYWIGFFLAAWCWLVAFTRGAWIGGAVALAVFAFGVWRQRAKLNWIDYAAIVLVAAMMIGVAVWSLNSPYAVTNFVKRFQSITETTSGSGQTRFQIWQAAWDATKARPLVGFGADTFRLVFPKYKPYGYVAAAGYLSVADNVHNYPLQLAAGIGIVGLLMLYAIFIWTAVRSGRVAFERSAKPRVSDRALFLGFWAACAGYIASLTFGLSVTGATMMLWVAMGVLLAPTAAVKEIEPPTWGVWVAAAGIVAAAVGIFWWTQWLRADHYYLLARIGMPGISRTAVTQEAVRLNPYNDMYRAEVGLAFQDEFMNYQNQAYQAQQSGQDPAPYLRQALDAFAKAESSFKETIAFVPTEYDNYVFLSNLYNNAGQFVDAKYYEQAIEWASKGKEVEPYGPAVRYQLARALVSTGKRAEAVKELEEAVKMDPAFEDGVLYLASLLREDGRAAEALPILKKLKLNKPETAGLDDAIRAAEASAGVVTTPAAQ